MKRAHGNNGLVIFHASAVGHQIDGRA
jgi:hypothetical protein